MDKVVAGFGVPRSMILVIRQVHDGMRVCVRLDDGVYSGWFAMEHDLRQRCILASLLFNILFAAVINMAKTRFKADKGIMNALVHPRKKTRAGVGGKQPPESQPSRRRFGACLTLTMRESYRNRPRS